eukprot:m.93060 g.93060  ORF g.93060 m.93060 type:complete len:898 (-) comp26600_c0_seq1:338-3031(-)
MSFLPLLMVDSNPPSRASSAPNRDKIVPPSSKGTESAADTKLRSTSPATPPYRLNKIEIHRSDAIDRIKFTYSDDTTWLVGHDGGKADPRIAIMTPGEYLVAVTHERFYNYNCAGAAVCFKTNKGRTFGYYPRVMATKKQSELVEFKAQAAHEIISLKIKRGVLEGIVQQPVPQNEQASKIESEWYVVASVNPKEDDEEDDEASTSTAALSSTSNVYSHFHSWTKAKAFHKQLAEKATQKTGRAVVLLDCISNKILSKSGAGENIEMVIKDAMADGFCAPKNDDDVTVFDAVVMLVKLLCDKKDFVTFLIVTACLVLTSIFELQSNMLAGKVLTMLNESPESPSTIIEDSWIAKLTCVHILDCDSATSPLLLYQQSLILSFVIVKCIERLVYVLNVYVHHNACDSKTRRLRTEVFKHVMRMDQAFFDTRSIQEIKGGMNAHTLSNLISWNIPYLITKMLKLVLIVYFMMAINPHLAAICVFSICVIKFGVLDVVTSYERGFGKVNRKLNHLREQIESTSLDMIGSIKMFSTEQRHVSEYESCQNRMEGGLHLLVVLRCVREWGYGTLRVFTFGAVLYFGLTNVISSGLKASELTSFFLIFTEFQDLFHQFKWHYDTLVRELPDIERFLELMATTTTMIDGKATLSKDTEGEIEFKDVRFAYPARPGEDVLKGLNLKLKKNSMTAIVGDSGAGKSTVSKLLMRLYDPKSDGVGSITIDGQPLDSFTQQSLHDQIAIVNQNPDLFGTSIGENVAYGAVGTQNATQAEIETACKLANCHSFITKFRAGYDTFVGGRGAQLSGGQKQRIAIARAAIRNPKILILDEATSALDAVNEKLVQDALESLMRGRTTLVIAHRLSTIRAADEIICMHDGVAVETGSHEELMANKGPYYNLICKQTL